MKWIEEEFSRFETVYGKLGIDWYCLRQFSRFVNFVVELSLHVY